MSNSNDLSYLDGPYEDAKKAVKRQAGEYDVILSKADYIITKKGSECIVLSLAFQENGQTYCTDKKWLAIPGRDANKYQIKFFAQDIKAVFGILPSDAVVACQNGTAPTGRKLRVYYAPPEEPDGYSKIDILGTQASNDYNPFAQNNKRSENYDPFA